MKKKKLSLQELKVQSFVTNIDKENKQTIQGGSIIGDIIKKVKELEDTKYPICADTAVNSCLHACDTHEFIKCREQLGSHDGCDRNGG